MKKIQIIDIIIGKRFRKDDGDIELLAENIKEFGLSQPITVTSSMVLIDGRRRLSALKHLGIKETDVHIRDIIKDEDGKNRMEFDANEYRKEFTKSEKVQALEAFKKDSGVTRGGNNNPTGTQAKRSKVGIPTIDPSEAYQRKNTVAEAVGFTSRDDASMCKTVVVHGTDRLIKLMDSETVGTSTLAKIAKNKDADYQDRYCEVVETYGKSKGYYTDYHHEVIRALEAKEIKRDKADGITEALVRRPERNVTWIKDNIKQHCNASAQAESKAMGTRKQEEYEQNKKYESWTDVKVSQENLAESARNILDVIGYENIVRFRKSISRVMSEYNQDESS